MISLEKWMILTPLQKLPNNVGNLGKIIVATGFEWLPTVQKIAQYGHTGWMEGERTRWPLDHHHHHGPITYRFLVLLYLVSKTRPFVGKVNFDTFFWNSLLKQIYFQFC